MVDISPSAWAAITAAVGTLIGFLGSRPKNRADAAAALTASAITIVNELQDEVARHRDRIESLELEVHECESRYDVLLTYLRTQGINPPGGELD